MDLTTYEPSLADAGVRMEILNPDTLDVLLDNAGSPMWLQLKSIDSETHKSVNRAIQNRRLQRTYEHGGNMRVRAEDLEGEVLTQLVRCTMAWHLVVDGVVPPCTEEEVRKVYIRFPWLRDQADRFRADRSNFFDKSRRNSSPTLSGSPSSTDEPPAATLLPPNT